MNSKLDLHGVKHSDVPRIVDIFLGKSLMNSLGTVTIITGKSMGMKNILREILLDYKLTYVENVLNTGEVIIDLK